ncbi:MAG TPA: sugar ABC transporter substrate-binding protein [Candidatus Atribacteria bacterium]|nr:sugar ABC transporter substrate-binding protein [Candidatus Atribacteria bacterium]
MKRFLVISLLTLVLVLSFSIFAFSADQLRFYVVSHGGPGDPFWGVVMKGMKDAANQYGVKATYLGPEKFSIQNLVNMLESAISSKPDGIAVTITNAVALDEPLRKAIKMGIPVIAINVPDSRPVEERIPYLCYVGMDEYRGGIDAAQRMLKEFTPKRAIVANHEPGHTGLELRAKGIKDVFSKKGIPVEEVDITANPTKAVGILSSYLSRYPETDAIFTLGPLGTQPALKLLEEKNLFGKVKLSGWDLTSLMVEAIKEGKLLFTIEQQQYLQGYPPIVFLYTYNKYGLIPHGTVLTGPAIVDKSNVSVVEETVAKGYR